MQDFWPSCGFAHLTRNARGWLVPTQAYWQLFLARPEMALVPESCPAEIALHGALSAQPLHDVNEATLLAIEDADLRDNYRHFLAFRDAVQRMGSMEAYYLDLLGLPSLQRNSPLNVPPLFINLVAQACLRNMLDECNDAFEVRAAEMLFRPQRIHSEGGQVLSGDQTVLDMLNETGGLGDIGRLLTQSNAPLRAVNLEVLTDANAPSYWAASDRHVFLLDLTHEVTNDLSHGLTFTMTRARSGLKALARALERWITHFLGVAVSIRPEQKIDDPQWRWHVGLDVESTALLNDLYEDRPVETARLQRLVSLFRLEFTNPLEMRADVAGKPIYLALCMTADKIIRLKPQNLLINLPLRAAN
jgi:hypothetical protein